MIKYRSYNDERVVGFAAPFVLGALTGGVTYAAFNPYRPKPVYNTYNPYGMNYYGGYSTPYQYY